jgi:hypothetical protein
MFWWPSFRCEWLKWKPVTLALKREGFIKTESMTFKQMLGKYSL